MRPTAADALDGAERLLRSLVDEGSLSQVDADPVISLLSRARVPSGRLAFLDADNRATLALLLDLKTSLPEDVSAEISSRALLAPTAPVLDLEDAERLNASLRELLAHAARTLAPGAQRERIRVHLLERTERQPV